MADEIIIATKKQTVRRQKRTFLLLLAPNKVFLH